MAVITTSKASLETVKLMLERGLVYRDIATCTGHTIQEISVIARILGLGRKRGPKVGSKRGPNKPKEKQ
jgi:hypothetical protein